VTTAELERRSPIPTPEQQTYATALLSVSAVSAATLAAWAYQRLGPRSPAAFLPIYVAVMALITGLALVTVVLPSVTTVSALNITWSIPVGIAVGFAALNADAAVRRHTRILHPPGQMAPGRTPAPGEPQALVRPDLLGHGRRGSLLAWLLAVAVLEEVLFRGVALDLALSLRSGPKTAGVLLGSIVLFAMAHQPFGWPDVAAKCVLGGLALLAALMLGSVAPAIVAHVVFNGRMWARMPRGVVLHTTSPSTGWGVLPR
jgi:membrane protease YdiL (CAAX protease family)